MGMMQKRVGRWMTYSPAILGILIMAPRLASPQFGLLDDGRTLSVAQAILGGDFSGIWEPSSGRSRPVYWLFNGLIYLLAGTRPLWFFVANTMVLVAITVGLIHIVRRLGGAPWQASAAGTLFAVAGPVVESFYTLSKPEPLQLAWLVLTALLCTYAPSFRSARGVALLVVACGATALMADLTKEASLIAMPIGAVWLLLALIARRRGLMTVSWRIAAVYLVANMAAAAAFLLLRMHFSVLDIPVTTYAGKYVPTFGRLLGSSLRWGGWLAWDSAYLIPLSFLAIGIPIRTKRLGLGLASLACLVWMALWLAFYLPWLYAAEYYLLPFAAGAAVIGGLAAGAAWEAMHTRDRFLNVATTLGLCASFLLFPVALANNAATGMVQLAVDKANQAMLSNVAGTLPAGSQVFVNIQDPNEYYYEIGDHLRLLHSRPDLAVSYFDFQSDTTMGTSTGGYYVLLPFLHNVPALTVRMGVVESTSAKWNRSLLQFLGSEGTQTFVTHQELRLVTVDMPRLFCPLARSSDYCKDLRPLLDIRLFEYGWEVLHYPSQGASQYRLLPDPPTISRELSPNRWRSGELGLVTSEEGV